MTNEVEFLGGIPIFGGLQQEDLSQVAQHARHHSFGPGEDIIREGDQDRRLFVIVEGEVEVVKEQGSAKERRVRALGPCSYFGEMALLDDLVRSATVRATKETQVLSLEQTDLHKALMDNPSMAVELLRMLSRRVRAVEKSLVHTLGGLLPICANCKAVRDEKGSWIKIERYIEDHSEADFTHGICPVCSKKLYPRLYQKEE
jgi:CRP-like cAMP-binding protein